MKLNWFSPLPPAETEIANYTARLVPLLCERADVTLWTDQQDWDPALGRQARVRRFHPVAGPWAEVNAAEVSIFHIGNNPFHHGGIWQASSRHPGVVVLHDVRLHDLFFCVHQEKLDRPGYIAHMARHHGPAAAEAAEKFWRGELHKDFMAANFPLTALACRNAAGVFVHTRDAEEQVRRDCPCPLLHVPLPYAAGPSHRRPVGAPRNPGEAYRLIVCGYIARNRRLDAVFQALAAMPERGHFRLDIYGPVWNADYMEAQLDALGLRGLVHLHGFVAEAELEAALASADLAVNLRFPTMGEASASQLRIWSHALPSLVTPVGWYATIPETAVDFVSPETEVADVQAALRSFLTDPARYARKGAEGRRILETRHGPAAYVEELLAFAVRVGRTRHATLAGVLVERAGAALSGWAEADGTDVLFRRAAEEIYRLAS